MAIGCHHDVRIKHALIAVLVHKTPLAECCAPPDDGAHAVVRMACYQDARMVSLAGHFLPQPTVQKRVNIASR